MTTLPNSSSNNSQLSAAAISEKNCCSNRCFQKLSSEVPHLQDKPLTDKATSSLVAMFMRNRDLFRTARKKNGSHTYVIKFENAQGGEINVCRDFFCYAYNIKKEVMKYVVRILSETAGNQPSNDALRFSRNGGERFLDSNSTSLVLRAQGRGVTLRAFSLKNHAKNTSAIAWLRCNEALSRNNKKEVKLFARPKLFNSGSAYAALFYPSTKYEWCADVDEDSEDKLNIKAKPLSITKDALALPLPSLKNRRAQAFSFLNSLLSMHAVLDPYRGVDGFSRLPTPFTVQALANMAFGNDHVRTLHNVRNMCASMRVLPYVRGEFSNSLDLTLMQRECSVCHLRFHGKRGMWCLKEYGNILCEPKFHCVFNIAASYAQERFIESLTLCSSLSLLHGAPLSAQPVSDSWSVEMGLCDVIVPQKCSVWQKRVIEEDGGVVFLSENIQQTPTEKPRYALPFVFASDDEHLCITLIEDAQQNYTQQIIHVAFFSLRKIFRDLLAHFRDAYEADSGDGENACRMRHHTLVIRCAPLLDLGGEVQCYAANLLRILCAELARNFTIVTYVLDLQWHWLPLEHTGVWFAPEQIGIALDHILNTEPYENLDEFKERVDRHMPEADVFLLSKQKAEKSAFEQPHWYAIPTREDEMVLETAGVMIIRGISRPVRAGSIAKPTATPFEVDTEQIFHVEVREADLKRAREACIAMFDECCDKAYYDTVDAIEEEATAPKGSDKLPSHRLSTLIVQFGLTSGTAFDGYEQVTLDRARRVSAPYPNAPVSELLFKAARYDSMRAPWHEWRDTTKMPPHPNHERLMPRTAKRFAFGKRSQTVVKPLALSQEQCFGNSLPNQQQQQQNSSTRKRGREEEEDDEDEEEAEDEDEEEDE